MIFTRSFGALRARSMFLDAAKRDEDLGRHGDVRFLDEDANRTEGGEESVA